MYCTLHYSNILFTMYLSVKFLKLASVLYLYNTASIRLVYVVRRSKNLEFKKSSEETRKIPNF